MKTAWERLQSHLDEKRAEQRWISYQNAEIAEFLAKEYNKPAYIIDQVTTKVWRLLSLSLCGEGVDERGVPWFVYDHYVPATGHLSSFREAYEWMSSAIERRMARSDPYNELVWPRNMREYDHKGKRVKRDVLGFSGDQ